MGSGKTAFVIAGTGSGCGKTTVTLGILRALIARGLRVQPFKVGPDYLDSGWHSAVCRAAPGHAAVTSRNLDAFMLPATSLNALYHYHCRQADAAVIEGVMGLYDGRGSDPQDCSSAALAKQLGCPVILLVDGKGVSTSVAATVQGFSRFDPELRIAGVILNRIGSAAHYALLRDAITRYCNLPVLGYLPMMPALALPARHLGLIPAQEQSVNDDYALALAQQMEATLDLDRLLALCQCASVGGGALPRIADPALSEGLTLALAHDDAFHFYYQDNLDLLAAAGITLAHFSPLTDRRLPACDMVYIGGGYPEQMAARLAANRAMHQALQQAQQARVPIYAECGGLMYLATTLQDGEGQRHTMAGLLPGESRMQPRLARLGYCEATAHQNTLLVAQGDTLRGHEFHYSTFDTPLAPAFTCRKYRDEVVTQQWQGGYQHHNTCASYLHLHFAQRPDLLNRWCGAARRSS